MTEVGELAVTGPDEAAIAMSSIEEIDREGGQRIDELVERSRA